MVILMSRDKLRDQQINANKATESVVWGFTYNELHASIIGASMGLICGILLMNTTHIVQFIVSLFVIDSLLLIYSKSIISTIFNTYPPTYGMLYTIRSEPWYYVGLYGTLLFVTYILHIIL